MAANVDKISSVSLGVDQSPKRPADVEPPVSQPPAADLGAAADYRLVIEEDRAAHTFVYKTVDRVSGKVISQLPREELLRMRENPDYVAGQVVKTKA